MTRLYDDIETFFKQQAELFPSEIYLILKMARSLHRKRRRHPASELERICQNCRNVIYPKLALRWFWNGNPHAKLLFIVKHGS